MSSKQPRNPSAAKHADHGHGLKDDLGRIARSTLDRRSILRWAVGLGVGASLLPIIGCGSDGKRPSAG